MKGLDDIQYAICTSCKRRFSKTSYVNRKLCFSCWYKKNKNKNKIKSKTLKEATDLYKHKSHEQIIRFLLRKKDDNIQRFEKLLKIKTFDIEKLYYNLRNIKISRNKIRIGLVDPQFYLEGCPFCHKEVKFDRLNFEGFYCPYCEKFIKRLIHPIIKETKVRLKNGNKRIKN
jgi:hypothetical protein